MPASLAAALRRIAPPSGAAGRMISAQFANSVGDGAYLSASVLYFTRVVGLSATQIGLGLTLGWAAGFLVSVPLGHLADRFGARRTAMVLAVCTSGSVALFLVIRSFPLFLLASCAYACCQTGNVAARQALFASVVPPPGRIRVRAYLQSTANAGLGLGAALGAIALRLDTAPAYRVLFAVDALSFLVSTLALRRVPVVPPAAPAAGAGPKWAVLRDKPYAVLTFLNMIMLLRMPIIALVIPLWIVERTDAPRWLVSALVLLNTVAVVLFGVRFARPVTDLASAVRSVRRSGVLALAACVLFAASGIWPHAWVAGGLLVVAACLLVAGEMRQSAGAWQLSFDLAPDHRQGQYQGFFGTGLVVARMLGPLLLTTVVLGWGVPGWLLLGALFLGSGLATGPTVRWAQRRAGERGELVR